MTKDTISETAALKALLSETADHQILAGMLGFVADRLMALDVDQLCGAGVHERSVGRVNHRNGYRPRRWETRAGTVDVQIPKLRKGTYFPGVSGTTPGLGESNDRGDPGSLHSGRLNAISG